MFFRVSMVRKKEDVYNQSIIQRAAFHAEAGPFDEMLDSLEAPSDG